MTAADLARVDVPLPELERRAALISRADQITAEKRATSAAGAAAENRHLLDPLDHAFETIPLAHPELIPASDWTPGRTP